MKKPPGVSNVIYALVITVSTNKHFHPSPGKSSHDVVVVVVAAAIVVVVIFIFICCCCVYLDVYVPFLSLEENGSPSSKIPKTLNKVSVFTFALLYLRIKDGNIHIFPQRPGSFKV